MTEYTTGTGVKLTAVHEPWRCLGRWCVIHNPMPGPWSDWPTHWRGDTGEMERICPCGVGHPAVESLRASGVHGCCGRHRCWPSEYEKDGFIEGEVVERRELEMK